MFLCVCRETCFHNTVVRRTGLCQCCVSSFDSILSFHPAQLRCYWLTMQPIMPRLILLYLGTAPRNSVGVYYGGWGEPMCRPQGETLQEVEGSKRCIWPSWCHYHSLSLASVKSRLVLVVAHPGNPRGPYNGCVCMCVSVLVLKSFTCMNCRDTPIACCYIILHK